MDENNQAGAAGDASAASAATDWRTTTLTPEFATSNKEAFEFAAKYKTPDEAAKGHFEAQKALSRGVVVPGDDADDATWQKFTEKLRPKDTSGYKMEIPDNYKQYFSDGLTSKMLERMQKEGMPARMANPILAQYRDLQIEQVKALATEADRIRAEDTAKLKADWGADYEKNMELGKRGLALAAKHAQVEGFDEILKQYGMDTHPTFQKVFAAFGQLFADADLHIGPGGEDAQDNPMQVLPTGFYDKVDGDGVST